MSTATEHIEETILSEDDVATPQGGRQIWRIADGKIVSGRTEDDSLQEREKIVGRLRRIGIYEGEGKDDHVPYQQLEADIEESTGMTRLKTGLSDKEGNLKPSVAALSFAAGLLELAKDELFVATASQGTKKNRFGKFSSYANLFHLDAQTKKTRPTKRRAKDGDKSMDEQWAELDAEIRKHPAFAERPASDADAEDGTPGSHLSALVQECIAKGWPHPEHNVTGWLRLMAKARKEPIRATLRDYTDDDWGQVRQSGLMERTECPAILLEDAKVAEAPVAPAKNANEEYDIFNDV